MMSIGIIGVGIVGGTIKKGFDALGYKTIPVDKKLSSTSIKDVIGTDIVYICLPTPSTKTGACDTTLVEQAIEDLCKLNYKGVIVIKSTVSVGTTDKLAAKFNRPIYFVPEFLRERCAYVDFTEGHDVLIIGHQEVFAPAHINIIVKSHGKYPKCVKTMKASEAELCKYWLNAFNACLVTFTNSMYDICKHLGLDYNEILDAVKNKKHIPQLYLECNENLRGFGGVCLPKDVSELARLAKEAGLKSTFFDDMLKNNAVWKTTVPEGMRLS